MYVYKFLSLFASNDKTPDFMYTRNML